MKTLRKGRAQKGWSRELICDGGGNEGGGCGATLLVEEGDLYRTYSFDMPTDELCITFTCHECGVETDVPHSKWPPHFDKLPDKQTWRRQHEKPNHNEDNANP